MKKYIVLKTTLIYKDGNKDILKERFETNDLPETRKRLIAEYGCKNIHFTFKTK